MSTGIPAEIWLRNVCRKNGMEIPDHAMNQLSEYTVMLLEWNKKINLVSRKDEENFWQKHILHSIAPLFRITLPTRSRILDLGTGGGLPGIPWAILHPDSQFVLLDATQKKIFADREMIDRLGLRNATAVWGRAEELCAQTELFGSFDLAVARAVAPLKDLVRWARPFLKKRPADSLLRTSTSAGKRVIQARTLLALKGGDLVGEITDIQRHEEVASINTVELVFAGNETEKLADKKLVIVEL